MSIKKLEKLPDDIFTLFDPDVHHEPNPENLEAFAQNLKDLIVNRLGKYEAPQSPLRFSSLGKHNRQMWYEAHPLSGGKEAMLPKVYMKFLYGDVIEQLLLFLAKEAGHDVKMEQAEVEVDGVKGHIDAVIDGVVVDVKSASPYGYKKFENNTVLKDDPFGYVAQLSGYASVLTPGKPAAWLAQEKVSGDVCVSVLPATVIKHHQPEARIAELRDVIAKPEPPERCFEDVPDGKSGNRKLATECSYCAHKFRCWSNLRTFIYARGPVYLTHVERVPDVPEVERIDEVSE